MLNLYNDIQLGESDNTLVMNGVTHNWSLVSKGYLALSLVKINTKGMSDWVTDLAKHCRHIVATCPI